MNNGIFTISTGCLGFLNHQQYHTSYGLLLVLSVEICLIWKKTKRQLQRPDSRQLTDMGLRTFSPGIPFPPLKQWVFYNHHCLQKKGSKIIEICGKIIILMVVEAQGRCSFPWGFHAFKNLPLICGECIFCISPFHKCSSTSGESD